MQVITTISTSDYGLASVVNLDSVRRLTGREREVLEQLALGRSTEEAAGAIFLSPHTVRCHVKSAMRKLGARTRPHAVALAIASGAIEMQAPLAAAI
jgi:DNA-binding CsgD family transcriptional regulator